jgi:hypothetical protein
MTHTDCWLEKGSAHDMFCVIFAIDTDLYCRGAARA